MLVALTVLAAGVAGAMPSVANALGDGMRRAICDVVGGSCPAPTKADAPAERQAPTLHEGLTTRTYRADAVGAPALQTLDEARARDAFGYGNPARCRGSSARESDQLCLGPDDRLRDCQMSPAAGDVTCFDTLTADQLARLAECGARAEPARRRPTRRGAPLPGHDRRRLHRDRPLP